MNSDKVRSAPRPLPRHTQTDDDVRLTISCPPNSASRRCVDHRVTESPRSWEKSNTRPQKCRQECKKSCPVVRSGKLCQFMPATPTPLRRFLPVTLCADGLFGRQASKSLPKPDLPSSPNPSALDVVSAPRSAPLAPSPLSTCLRTSRARSHTDTPPTASSCTDCEWERSLS